MQTVNVVEIIQDIPQSLRAFADNKDGNAQAETLFADLIREYRPDIEASQVNVAIEDGFWVSGDYYSICLIHSQ